MEEPLNKNRKVSESKNVSGLVSLLNGCQVVRMMELLRTFWNLWSISEGRGDWEVVVFVTVCRGTVFQQVVLRQE